MVISTLKKSGLKTKAVALAIALGTVPVLLIGSTAFTLANRSITEEVIQAKKARAITVADKVNNFMFQRYGDIQLMANLAILADPRISKITSIQSKEEALDRYIKTYRFYDSIAVADMTGKTILQSTGEAVTGLAERDYFQEVVRTNRPVITAPRQSTLTGEWSIFAAAPVKDVVTGKTIAVIRSRMPVEYLKQQIESLATGGEEYDLFDSQGKRFIAHKSLDLEKEVSLEYPFLDKTKTTSNAVAKIAFSEKDKQSKVLAIASTKSLEGMPNINWNVLLDLDKAVAFETQRQLLITLLMGTIITAAIVSAIAATLANRAAISLNEIVNVVASSSSEIATTVEQQESTVNQQAAVVNQTTSTMDELNTSSMRSAQQAEAAATTARQVLALVDNSAIADNLSVAEQSSLRDKVSQIAEKILGLSQQVSQISNITNLVSDLANKTNMLALNAAVEAVRAGEQGKGFGVVATEIRKLADQSKKSAQKINNVVADIQQATHSTVMVTDEGKKTVEDIVAAVNIIAGNSQEIFLNARQQSAAIQQVVDTMNTLNVAAKESATGISKTKIGTQKLESAALDLKAMV